MRTGQIFGMINNKLLSHNSMLYQDDWRSCLFNLVQMHYPAFAGWDLNPAVDGPNLAFPDDDGVFTKVLIAHGYLDDETWGDHNPIYLIDVKTSLNDRCDDFFLSNLEHERVSRLPSGATDRLADCTLDAEQQPPFADWQRPANNLHDHARHQHPTYGYQGAYPRRPGIAAALHEYLGGQCPRLAAAVIAFRM
jgi:hypothetical protein